MNYSLVASSLLALAAPSALAFQTSTSSSSSAAPITLKNALRDMAAYPDDTKMMSEFEAFDRNGAFSRSPQQQQQRGGGVGRRDMMQQGGGRPQDMMYDGPPPGGMMGGNPMTNPFARRGGDGGGGRSLDGFDPHSAYGNSHGMSQSDSRRGGNMMMGGMEDYGMDYYAPPDMMMMMGRGGGGGGRGGGMGGMRNGVRDTNTMGGFSYSSRNAEYGGYDDRQGMMGGGGGGFDGPGPMMMGGGGYDQGPMMGGGGGWSTIRCSTGSSNGGAGADSNSSGAWAAWGLRAPFSLPSLFFSSITKKLRKGDMFPPRTPPSYSRTHTPYPSLGEPPTVAKCPAGPHGTPTSARKIRSRKVTVVSDA